MKALIERLLKEGMEESSVDFPQPDLCSQVWNKTGDTYVLKPEVEKKVYELLSEYPKAKLLDLADEIHIIGSIGTNQYDETSDIDVHLVIPPDKMPLDKSKEDWQKDIKKWYKDNIQSLDAYVGQHPIEVYYQLTPAQEMLADALYDVKKREWIKGPKKVEVDYNPYSRFKEVLTGLQDALGETDELLAELKRDVIDYDVIKLAIAKAPIEVKKKLTGVLKAKLEEIENGAKELLLKKKEWVDMRKQASAPTTANQALKDIELVRQWEDTNALFKFISRYQYIKLISEIETMMGKDMQLEDEEVNRIKTLLGVMQNDSDVPAPDVTAEGHIPNVPQTRNLQV